jgi:hypothetical protein
MNNTPEEKDPKANHIERAQQMIKFFDETIGELSTARNHLSNQIRWAAEQRQDLQNWIIKQLQGKEE